MLPHRFRPALAMARLLASDEAPADALPSLGPELCEAIDDARGNQEDACAPIPIVGYIEVFCRPLPTLSETYLVTEGLDATWRLTDCRTRKTLEVLLQEVRSGLDVFEKILACREHLLAKNPDSPLSDIAATMANLGTRHEFGSKRLIRKDVLEIGANAVPQDQPCLPFALPVGH
jgi:hypothetical protein